MSSPEELIEEFMELCEPIPEAGCWLWTGGLRAQRYGSFKTWYAHRFSFEAFSRPLRAGEVVRHTCDTPLCVNPDHLRAGSQRDNMQDALVRGRLWLGSSNPAARHSADTVAYIKSSPKPNVELANELGLDPRYVWRVRANKIRKHG